MVQLNSNDLRPLHHGVASLQRNRGTGAAGCAIMGPSILSGQSGAAQAQCRGAVARATVCLILECLHTEPRGTGSAGMAPPPNPIRLAFNTIARRSPPA